MKHAAFIKMPKEEMAEIVWTNGTFLSKKIFSHACVEVYSLYNFFVEIWLSTSQNNRNLDFLTYIKSSAKTDILDKYIMDEECFKLIKACQ